MKRFGSITLVMFMLVSLTAFSQQGQQFKGGMGKNADQVSTSECRIPNLTDDQQQKIKDLRLKHIKEVTPLKNELGEKKARMRTLQSADKQDLNAINKNIDEMASLRAQIQKKAAAHRAEVASLLTDEQRVFFNSHKGNGMGKGMKHGGKKGARQGRGMGNCNFGQQN